MRPSAALVGELVVDIFHHRRDDFALRVGERVARAEQAAVLAALIVSVLMPSLSYRPLTAILPPTTPIEPVIGAGLGEDLVGAHGDVVAAAAGDVAHAGDDRLLDDLRFAPDQVAGERRAAGAVDAQDDRLDLLVFVRLAERFDDRGRAHHFAAERIGLALAGHDRADGVDDGDLLAVVALGRGVAAHHGCISLMMPIGPEKSVSTFFLP